MKLGVFRARPNKLSVIGWCLYSKDPLRLPPYNKNTS